MSDTIKIPEWPYYSFDEVAIKTLRDEFAIAALIRVPFGHYFSVRHTAEAAYELADAMLEARKKGAL